MPPAVKTVVRTWMLHVGRVVGATGISPDLLTFIGLIFNGIAGAIVGSGALLLGGGALLLASAFDMLDGAVARATGKSSRFGAFLDSLVDRYSETVVFVGLIVWFLHDGNTMLVVVSAVALAGSLLVSYARARAEGMGLECEVGFLQRPERVILLAAGMLLGDQVLTVVLWLLAIVTHFTVVQRAFHVYRLLRDETSKEIAQHSAKG